MYILELFVYIFPLFLVQSIVVAVLYGGKDILLVHNRGQMIV